MYHGTDTLPVLRAPTSTGMGRSRVSFAPDSHMSFRESTVTGSALQGSGRDLSVPLGADSDNTRQSENSTLFSPSSDEAEKDPATSSSAAGAELPESTTELIGTDPLQKEPDIITNGSADKVPPLNGHAGNEQECAGAISSANEAEAEGENYFPALESKAQPDKQ